MARWVQCWRIAIAFAILSMGATCMKSINLELETIGATSLTVLGTPNLEKYNGEFDLQVWGDEENGGCTYSLTLQFNVSEEVSPRGDPGFEGRCAPNESTGNATDGLPWHAHRRNWIKFPQYVFDATGFDHLSLEWLPCGRNPAGFRQPRFDLNFYTVTPEYRTYMKCDVFKTPSVCQYDQSTHIGRAHFTLPRLAIDPKYLVNLPLGFAPDPDFPEAFPTEGLTHYDPEMIPRTTDEWTLPSFLMTTHDAAVVSWRAMIPHVYFSEKLSASSSEYQYYVYQTMPGLPSNWSTAFDGPTQMMSVELNGVSNLCGSAFDQAKGDSNEKFVFDDLWGNATASASDEDMIN